MMEANEKILEAMNKNDEIMFEKEKIEPGSHDEIIYRLEVVEVLLRQLHAQIDEIMPAAREAAKLVGKGSLWRILSKK